MKTHSLRCSIAASRAHLVGALALLSLASSGCGSSADEPPHNLGNTADNLETDQPPPLATLQDFAGAWVGEAEDPLALVTGDEPSIYRFPSGSSQIRLELAPGQQWTISFGSVDAPPPPTNFDVGYPEGVNYASDALRAASVLPPVEGFRYTLAGQYFGELVDAVALDDMAVQDGVLRLYYMQNQVFTDWCSAQTPLLAYGDVYTCVGTQAWRITDETECSILRPGVPADGTQTESDYVPIDCGKLHMCDGGILPICNCDVNDCYSNPTTTPGLFLRAHGDELVGAFAKSAFMGESGDLTSVGTVRFHRAQ